MLQTTGQRRLRGFTKTRLIGMCHREDSQLSTPTILAILFIPSPQTSHQQCPLHPGAAVPPAEAGAVVEVVFLAADSEGAAVAVGDPTEQDLLFDKKTACGNA